MPESENKTNNRSRLFKFTLAGLLLFNLVLVFLLLSSPTPALPQTVNIPPTPLPTATPEPTLPPPTSTTLAQPTATPTPQPTPEPTAIPTPTPAPVAGDDVVVLGLVSTPPTQGKWIDLNLRDGFTRLMDGPKLVKAIPSAWGYGEVGTDTDFYSTAPGSYSIYSMSEARWFDWQYSQRWIYSFVGFDPERANGFHSFLYDEKGNVVENDLGPNTHGCVRLDDWKAVYDFAEIGMSVIVHHGIGTTPSTSHNLDQPAIIRT